MTESNTYKVCGQCRQYINLEMGHYDVLQTTDEAKHSVHHDFCSGRFREEHQCTVLETHVYRR